MANDTTAALQAIMQQLTTLTEKVEAQDKIITSTKSHNDRLLDQIKDQKRADSPLEKGKRLLAALDKQEAAEAAARANATANPAVVTLTREQARDPQQYREAKAAAAKASVPLEIVSDAPGDPMFRNTIRAEIAQTKTITLDDDHHRIRYVRADHDKGSGLIQRRLAAEQAGFKTVTWRTPEDLPQHMQTKLTLMESAANAADS